MRLVRSLVLATGGVALLAGSLTGPAVGAGPAGRSTPNDCPLDTWTIPQAMQLPTPAPRVSAADSSRADTSNLSSGRFVLCLDGGRIRTGTASCSWSEDRQSVDGLNTSSFQLRHRERSADLYVGTDGPRLSFMGSGRGGYRSDRGGTLDVVTPLGRTGIASFTDIAELHRTDRVLTGRLGWRCGEAPPRKKGHTSGSLAFTLSAPLAGTFTTGAYCTWVDVPDGRVVAAVTGEEHRTSLGDGRYLTMSLDLEPRSDGPFVTVYVRVADASFTDDTDWIAQSATYVLAATDGGRSGQVRALALHPGAFDGEDPSLLDPAVVGADVSWDCGEPPARAAGPAERSDRPTVPGSAMLTFQDAPIRSVSVAATCHANIHEHAVSVSDLAADLTISGLRARLFAIPESRYVLMLLADDGSPLGEYIAEPSGDDLIGSRTTDEGWQETTPITFQPGPTRTPPALFGAAAPEPFQAIVTTDCPVPAPSAAP